MAGFSVCGVAPQTASVAEIGIDRSTDKHVAIIGAGPAGMSAALRTAERGASVIVLDEQARVGGQIFRQSPHDFEAAASSAYKLYPFGKRLVERAEENQKIDGRFRQTVWGIFRQADGFKVCSGSSVIHSRSVIVATGAYELPVAFPGWTKPGVMGVGAIQASRHESGESVRLLRTYPEFRLV